MKRLSFVLLIIVGVAGFGPIGMAEELKVLATPGPWPVADGLIRYQGKIWFSTAVKGVNHNSADIWSFDPAVKKLQFERYLFSQDVGNPLVHKGLLYWPHEDMRIGLGSGVISVTNGVAWQELSVPSDDYMMHTHATTEWNGHLVTAMAGWNSVVSASTDAGKSWQVLANEAPRVGSFHRFNHIAGLNGRLFARHWEKSGISLAEFKDGRMIDVEGWPSNRQFSNFVTFQGALYSLVSKKGGAADLWRVGAGKPEKVEISVGAGNRRLLFSDGENLWIVIERAGAGELWASPDGETFDARHSFSGGLPYSAFAVSPGEIYLGGEGADGKARIWGPETASQRIKGLPSRANLPAPRNQPLSGFRESDETSRLLKALSDPEMYQGRGRPLRLVLAKSIAKGPPDNFYSSFLDFEVPEGSVATFGGRFQVSMREIANWHLLNAMAINKEKKVPVRFLKKPWQRKPNGPQKWLDELLIALHTVQRVEQRDTGTIETLLARLDFQQDPDWLQSQVTGTLSTLTGKSFAYDRSQWQQWWKFAKKDWSKKTGGE